MSNDTKDSVVEFTVLIPELEIKMTSALPKEDAVMILKKTMVAISLAKNQCEYCSDHDLTDLEEDESEPEQS